MEPYFKSSMKGNSPTIRNNIHVPVYKNVFDWLKCVINNAIEHHRYVSYVEHGKKRGKLLWLFLAIGETFRQNKKNFTKLSLFQSIKYNMNTYRILDGCEEIWILCSSGKNNISRVSAANEGDIGFDIRT
jgi:hypothetical protein